MLALGAARYAPTKRRFPTFPALSNAVREGSGPLNTASRGLWNAPSMFLGSPATVRAPPAGRTPATAKGIFPSLGISLC